MSGSFRMRIGPIRSKLSELLQQTDKFLQIPADITSEQCSELCQSLSTLIRKIERQIALLTDWDKQYVLFLSALPKTERKTEDEKYQNFAITDDTAYLSILEGAQDSVEDLNSCSIIIDRRLSSFNCTGTSSPANANSVVAMPSSPIPLAESAQPIRIRLSEQNLKRFEGDLLKWNEFWDCFNAAIHSQQRISEVQKFTYLKQCLTGTPASLVEGLPITNANYLIAINILTKRYGKPDVQKALLYNQFANLPRSSTSLLEL